MFRIAIVISLALGLTACGMFQKETEEVQSPPPAPPPPVEVVSCPEPEPCVCPEPEKIIVPAPPTEPCKPAAHDMMVIGQVEYVIVDASVRTKARIDTGAKTSSINATDIVEFERDGKPWVRFGFSPADGDEPVAIERPVSRRVLIKRHGFDPQRRYVVTLGLAIGNIEVVVEVTLSDRSDFEFPVLIGRNFLTDNAVVDVSRQFIAP